MWRDFNPIFRFLKAFQRILPGSVQTSDPFRRNFGAWLQGLLVLTFVIRYDLSEHNVAMQVQFVFCDIRFRSLILTFIDQSLGSIIRMQF